MNKFKRSPILIFCVLFVAVSLAVVGCQRPPTKEKADTEAAEKDAVAANAEKLAPEEYQAAVTEKQAAETEMTGKNYEKAKTSFVAAKDKFTAAKDAASEKLEKIKSEIEPLSQKAAETKGTVSQLIESASSSCIDEALKSVLPKIKDKGKKKEAKTKINELKKQIKSDFDKNLTDAKDNLTKADATIQQASGLSGDENILEKKEKLDDAIKQLEEIKVSLDTPCNNAKSEAEKLVGGEAPQVQ